MRKTKMPKVSVVVPVYNVEPYLRQCLDSVLAQTFPDFELILIDDGSADNCGAICDKYAGQDSRIRVIHQENRGLGCARNVGMDQAVGMYIVFLDSDDYWLPDTLETLYAEAEKNQTQVLCFGGIKFQEGTGKILRKYTYSQKKGMVRSGPDSVKTALDAGEYYYQACCQLYLLDYVRETGLRFDEGIIHEDVRFTFLSRLLAERVECMDVQLYLYRSRPDSIMGSFSALSSAHGYRVSMDGLLDAYDELALSPLGRELLVRHSARCIVMIRERYKQALAQIHGRWRTARRIQRDVRKTLKRARALPSLPRSTRLATYSLLLDWFTQSVRRFAHRAYRKLKRLLRVS